MTSHTIDETHDPALGSWVDGANGHRDFPIQNLPLGIFAPSDGVRRAGVAIGDSILDLAACAAAKLLPEAVVSSLGRSLLNELFALPASSRRTLRRQLSRLLADESNRPALTPHLFLQNDCTLYLPAAIGDYSDFYVGIHHAQNVGRLFRPDAPLLSNYKWVPIGYHGRASSIRPSGDPVIRPNGQRKLPDSEVPVYGPSQRLDYELELGVWIGQGNNLGSPIPIDRASEHIAGFCLLNDWSARDLQAWEYQPLGPFLAKSFHTTISPWVITSEALAPFRIPQPARPSGDPRPLPYLWDENDQRSGALALELTVTLSTARMRLENHAPVRLSFGEARHMYWTVAQILTHHTSNGSNLNPGDLLGTGTISSPDRDGYGSLLEITGGGAVSISLPTGESRRFLEDGDEVVFYAAARHEHYVSIGFGPCRGEVRPLR